MEIFGYHPDLKKWTEIGNSGMFRPEMLLPMGLPKVSTYACGPNHETAYIRTDVHTHARVGAPRRAGGDGEDGSRRLLLCMRSLAANFFEAFVSSVGTQCRNNLMCYV